VSAFNLSPGKAQLIPYTRPQMGVVLVRAHASAPLRVYMLDSKQREEYLKGGAAGGARNFESIATAAGETVGLAAPVPTTWFLVIENPNTERAVDGEYSVSAVVPTSVPSGAAGPLYGDPGIVYGDPLLRYGGKR
jgi:hypothetical protein